MWTFNCTNNIRNALKMKLSQYSWYLGSSVIPYIEGYAIQVDISSSDPKVTRAIPAKIKNTWIKIQLKLEQQQ